MATVDEGDGATQGETPPTTTTNSNRSDLLAVLQPPIKARSEWAEGLPAGATRAEQDVRILVVHHTASQNTYTQEEVVDELRGFYKLHREPERGWPDIAYNFLIDRFGTVWEGREGSLNGPVEGDATGGSQGYSQLCSLIGNFTTESPTQAAIDSLNQTLAWLGERYGVDTTPGTKVSFKSKGSTLWPAGRTVTVPSIAAHRDLSQTKCPGDPVIALLASSIPETVTNLRREASISVAPPPTTGPPPTTTPRPSSQDQTKQTLGSEAALTASDYNSANANINAALAVAGGATAAIGGLLWLRTRRQRAEE